MARPPVLLTPLALALVLGACGPGGGAEDAPPPAEEPASALREAPEHLDPAAHGIGGRIADLAFADVVGEGGRLSDYAGAKALAVVVRDFECPVSRRIGHETARIEADYGERGVAFLFLFPGDAENADVVAQDVEAFGFRGRFALDPGGALVGALGARTTTDVFVLNPDRTLVYRGAVSDRVGRGYQRESADAEYLRDALDDVLAGRAVRTPATSAPGCFLAVD